MKTYIAHLLSVLHTKASANAEYYGDHRYGNRNDIKHHWYGLKCAIYVWIYTKLK